MYEVKPEQWQWKVCSFDSPYLVVPEVGHPPAFLNCCRIRAYQRSAPVFQAELGTWGTVLMPIRVYLYDYGPFERSGRDHFVCEEVPRAVKMRIGKGLFLRPAQEHGSYPRAYEHDGSPPRGISVSWMTSLSQALGIPPRHPRATQVRLLEEHVHLQRLEARQGATLSDAELYAEKLEIKLRMLNDPSFLTSLEIPGLIPFNASDLFLLERSLRGYREAQSRGEPY